MFRLIFSECACINYIRQQKKVYIIVLYFISKLSKSSVTDFYKADESYIWGNKIINFIAVKERKCKEWQGFVNGTYKNRGTVIVRDFYGPLEYWLSSPCHCSIFYWQSNYCSLGSLGSRFWRKDTCMILWLVEQSRERGRPNQWSVELAITIGNWLLYTVEPSRKLCELGLWTITLGERGKCIYPIAPIDYVAFCQMGFLNFTCLLLTGEG